MKIYRSLDNLPVFKNAVVTLGTFDGVHKGHRKLLSFLQEKTLQTGRESILLTFWPHPRMVLQPDDNSLKLLNTPEEKIALLENSGLDNLIIIPFTLEFSRLGYLEFIRDILVEKLGVKLLIVGYDHHFGKNREGTYEQLAECAPIYDFALEQVPAEEIGDISISSTKIRKALAEGDVLKAAEFLGYPYFITGKVVHGDKLGRELGYPTANLEIPESYKLVPGDGVYAVTVKYGEIIYQGMMSIGDRPTVGGIDKRLEVNIFNFEKEIYDENLTIFFMDKLRNQAKFANLKSLIDQITADKAATLKVLLNH